MAANNAKPRLKDSKGKYIKRQNRRQDNVVEPDLSALRKPVLTNISSFGQARKIFDGATEELKALMTTECDVMFECRVCRSIFRSLVNFFSHKRVYCKEKFNNTVHGHYIKPHSTLNEMMKLKQQEEDYQEFIKNSDRKEDEVPDERVPISKDLTSVIENLNKNKEIAKSPQRIENEPPQVSLQAISTSTAAVYQNVVAENEDSADQMSTEVNELHAIFAKDTAVLNQEGKFKIVSNAVEKSQPSSDPDQVIQISDDEEEVDSTKLKCLICDFQFATRKTLKYHVQYKHVENRLVYPCPECLDLFAASWSVYRHLFKVHKKTPAQIRRMRESIQSKAFRVNNPPAYYEKRKNNIKLLAEQKLSEEERMDRENQAWMDNMEGDEVPRCGGCGRSFERRAALAAHTHTCQSRTRALARKPLDTKRNNIPIRKAREDDSKLAVGKVRSSIIGKNNTKEVKDEDDEMETEQLEDEASDEEKPEDDPGSDQDAKKDDKIQLSFPEETEQENMEALKKEMKPFIDQSALQCKKCERRFASIEKLTKHLAFHLNWTRYACKLCNYKTYEKDTLLGHLQVVHKLKGNAEFYMSTVKALGASEALQFADIDDNDSGDADDVESPDSKRETDSNYSDNESVSSNSKSSSVLKRRRNFNKPFGKRRKAFKSKSASPNDEQKPEVKKSGQIDKVMRVIFGDEQDSSDKDKKYDSSEIYKRKQEKMKQLIEASSNIRRPVRKRVRPKKDDDFEYDLSNLLRRDAEANKEMDKDKEQKTVQRRDETTSRPAPYKRKHSEAPSSDETTEPSRTKVAISEPAKEKLRSVFPSKVHSEASKATFRGALRKLSNVAVQQSRAHLKQLLGSNVLRNVLAAPYILRAQSLPKPTVKTIELKSSRKMYHSGSQINSLLKSGQESPKHIYSFPSQDNNTDTKTCSSDTNIADTSEEHQPAENKSTLNVKPSVFQRSSVESSLKKPIRITDLTKSGKILLVKPVNRNMDASHPFKIQTIKCTQSDKDDKLVTVRLPSIDCNIEVGKEKPPDIIENGTKVTEVE